MGYNTIVHTTHYFTNLVSSNLIYQYLFFHNFLIDTHYISVALVARTLANFRSVYINLLNALRV